MSGGALRPAGRWRAALAALLLGLAGAAAAAPPRLTLAVADLVYSAPALVAESRGYFAEEGLDLDVIRCVIGQACLKRLLDGEAHFATVADTPITFAAFRRRDFAIVATMTTSGREARVVVRADRGLRTPADLKGKRLGVIRGTSGHYFAETFLLLHGIAPADVSLVALEPGDAIGPLVRGEVDAASLFEPHGSSALQALGDRARALPTPSFFSITFNLVSVPEAAGGRDEDLVKLLRALRRATEFIQAQPEQAQAIVARAARQSDPGLVARGWSDFSFRIELAQPLITTLEAQARWAQREKLVPADAPLPSMLDLVRPEPLRRLDARAVRILK